MNYYNASSGRVDDDKKAHVLTYLAVVQLVVRARTGGWLRNDQVEKLTRIWCYGNGGEPSPCKRMPLRKLSETVAFRFLDEPRFADPKWLLEIFTHRRRLDYSSPVVLRIHAACENELNRIH